jgi:hypothetical protein
MGARIPRSNGVFPPIDDDSGEGQLSTLETQLDSKNYRSVYDDREGAQGELDRLVNKGFAEIVPLAEIMQKFKTGTVSKLALITKVKPNGVVKHRLIIDLLRSGGNSLASIPERIVLPRRTWSGTLRSCGNNTVDNLRVQIGPWSWLEPTLVTPTVTLEWPRRSCVTAGRRHCRKTW